MTIVYTARTVNGPQLALRRLDEMTPRVLAGTVAGIYPTFVSDGSAPDGKRIYYRANRMIVAATITTSPTFAVTRRDTLFADTFATDPFHTNYDIAPDGTHFVMLQPVETNQHATVVLNFANEVRAKMAAAKR